MRWDMTPPDQRRGADFPILTQCQRLTYSALRSTFELQEPALRRALQDLGDFSVRTGSPRRSASE